MKQSKRFILCCLMAMLAVQAIAQDEPDNRPVLDPYASPTLIDNPTTLTPWPGSFQYVIQHRFGVIEELSDLYGIYAPSNIRMGINYGITENIMVGFGTEKNNKLQDFSAKYRVLTQTRSGSMPVSVAVYGNMAVDARDEEVFGVNYKFTNRLSYFSQLIVSRKFSHWLTLHVAPSFSHVNAADSLIEHDIIGVHAGGRAVFRGTSAFIFEYHHPLLVEGIMEYREWHYEPQPSLALGVEFGTATHAFQVFVAPFEHLVPQKNYLFNYNELGDMRVGFNITVRF